MNNPNEQFVEPSDLEKILDTKIVLTSSYQALVADLQTQNQQLTEKLIVAMEENAKLREQLFTNKGLAKVSLPNLPMLEQYQTPVEEEDATAPYIPYPPSFDYSSPYKGYASPF